MPKESAAVKPAPTFFERVENFFHLPHPQVELSNGLKDDRKASTSLTLERHHTPREWLINGLNQVFIVVPITIFGAVSGFGPIVFLAGVITATFNNTINKEHRNILITNFVTLPLIFPATVYILDKLKIATAPSLPLAMAVAGGAGLLAAILQTIAENLKEPAKFVPHPKEKHHLKLKNMFHHSKDAKAEPAAK